MLLEYLDPDLVKMQFQMSSMRTVGNPIMYFTNHPGRFVSAHLQGVDLEAPMPPSRAGMVPAEADAGGTRKPRRRAPGAAAQVAAAAGRAARR